MIEPSLPFGDAPCPHCGSLLWFVASGESLKLYDPQHPDVVAFVASYLGVRPEVVRSGNLNELGADSLDLVELVMELEDQLD